jgi:hypothetical protein
MNLVGKIFTILIFVMSLVFMSFAVMVYGTHKNWRLVVDNPPTSVSLEKPLGLSQQLGDARKLNQQLTDENDRVNRDLATLKVEKQESLAKLETENDRLKQERTENETKIRESENKARDAVAAMKATQETLAHLRDEVALVRTQITKATTDREASFKEVVRLTDELHGAVDARTQLNERNVELSADLARAREALRYFKVNEKSDYKAKTPPAGLEAVVLAVPDKGLVEISLGEDDGLRQGHKLEVVRVSGGASAYVGRIEVVRVTPDRAVCRVIPDMLKMPMQVGDRVYSKLD